MILAAGRGERMRPLTDQAPKPLLPAGGKPLIAWQLLRLAAAGIRDIVINHAWLGDKVEAALGDGSAFGVRIRYSAEREALETAGGIAQALPLLAQEPFLVVNGDVFCDFDYGRVRTIVAQMKHARLACWCVMVPNPQHHPAGDFTLAGGLLGSSGPARLTYAGIGVYTPEMFDGIPRGQKAALRPCLEREMATGRAAGEYHGGLWFDIGTVQRLAELDRLLTSGSITVGV
jgi:MurNAc alpha-1-phosphate uridylyltransferase